MLFCFKCEVDSRHIGWLNCPIPEEDCKCIQLSLRGPDHSLRVRQVKVLGDTILVPVKKSVAQIQQMNCEAETLKVFRLLTSQVSICLVPFFFHRRKCQNLESCVSHYIPILTNTAKGDYNNQQLICLLIEYTDCKRPRCLAG